MVRGTNRNEPRRAGRKGCQEVCSPQIPLLRLTDTGIYRARKALDPTIPSAIRRQDRPAKTGGFIKQTYSTLVRHISGCRKWHIVAYFSVRKPVYQIPRTEMKVAFRATTTCDYPLSLITSTFGNFASLTAFSYLERPARGNWNLPNLWLWMRPPHLGPRTPTMITSGVGPTLTIAKARNVLRRPPRHAPPFLRNSRACPCRRLIRPVNICTHCLLWRLWRLEVRLGHLRQPFGMRMTRLGQKVPITPALLRTAGLSRASESRCKQYSGDRVEFFRIVVHPVSKRTLYRLCHSYRPSFCKV